MARAQLSVARPGSGYDMKECMKKVEKKIKKAKNTVFLCYRFRCTDCDGPIDVVEVYVPDTDTGAWINIGTSEQLKGRLSFVSL